jgi:hypothetical protein
MMPWVDAPCLSRTRPLNAIRLRVQIQSGTLTLPELGRFIGKMVEVVALEGEPAQVEDPQETREAFFGLLPAEPAQGPAGREDELRRLREMARGHPKLAAFPAAAAADGIDEGAIIRLRARG